jgi:PAS domain S-box-containing protein
MKDSNKIVLLAIVGGMTAWLIDGVLDWLVFQTDQGSLLDMLFFKVPGHDIFVRCLILLMMLVFAWIAARMMERRRRMEAELDKSEKLFTSIVEQSPFPIWIADANGENIRHNQAFAELIGLDENAGKIISYNLLEDNVLQQQGHLEKLEKVFLRGEPVSFISDYDISQVKQLNNPDGSRRLLEITVFPVADRQGCVVNAVVQYEDITEKRRVEKAIRESEERFRAMFDTSRDLMAIIDGQDKLQWTNLAWCDVFGFAPGVHVDWFSKVHPDDLENFFVLWHNVQNSMGEINNLELRLKSHSGRYVVLETTIRSIEVDGREMLFFDGYDITLRKRTEQKLSEEKERLRVTLKSIAEGVIAADAEGNVVLINDAAEQLTGWSSDEGFGRPLSEVLSLYSDSGQQVTDNLIEFNSCSAEYGLPQCQCYLQTSQGTRRLVDIHRSAITNDKGDKVGVVVVFNDVTDSRRLEEELQRADKLESLGVLAGGIAHDFNNILTSVLGNIELARIYSEDNEKVNETLDRAKDSSLSAKELTSRLLTFSKGGAPLKRKQDVAQLTLDSVRLALSGSNVQAQLDIASDLWEVEVDIDQFGQVIRNLVVNAVQSMPQGGDLLVAAANSQPAEHNLPNLDFSCIVISVTDKGPGIDRESVPKIFDPFFSTKDRGSGLGLSVCYSIIQRHGGLIDVQSEPGKGSTFRVFLPAFPLPVTKGGSKVICRKESGRELRVLLVDDEAPVRQLVQTQMELLGHSCVTAADGAVALELYRQQWESSDAFDLVILDLTIPGGMGGEETLAGLKKIDPEVNAVVTSGYSKDPIIADYSDHGFIGALIKPFDIRELSDMLDQLFGNVENR